MRKIKYFYFTKRQNGKSYLLVIFSVLLILMVVGVVSKKFNWPTSTAATSTYYMSTSGSDNNPGTQDKPFSTFKHAFSIMRGGDTLLVADGTYSQSMGEWKWENSVKIPTSAPPSGAAGNYTTVKGQNIRGIVNGIDIVGSSYIKIEGFKSLSKVDIDESNHIELRKIGAKGGIQTARSSYVTKEDVWGWNDNRYVIHNFKADHVIDNRVIGRLDQLASEATGPVGAISHYLTDNSVIANALLFDVTDNYPSKFAYDLVYSSRPSAGNDQIWGLIGFNPGSMLGGIYPGDGSGSNYEINNSVIWGTTKRCVRFNSSGPLKVKNTTCGENDGSSITSSRGPVDVNDNIFYNNGGGVGSVASCDNNLFYNSGSAPAGCTNTSTSNPDIKWLPRSPVAGKGAKIENKYMVTEVNGKFVVSESDQKLWPWPYEDLIKQDMCEGVTKGWCGTNKTLTQYVWEYLGTPCPADICSGGTPTPPDTTKPSIPNALSATSISPSQIDLSWTASTDNIGVTGYKVYRNGTSIGTTTITGYSDKGLTANTAYTYTISAYDAAGNNSDLSAGASATTKEAVAVPPSDECEKTNVLCVDDTVGNTQEYATIQLAATAAKAGDTVLIHEGTYAGFQVSASGTQTLPIIFKNSGVVTINTSGPTGDGVRLENVNYVIIDGFKIENISARCIAARGATPADPMKGITIKNNSCANSTTEGFYLSQLNSALIENNTITNSGKGIGSRNHGLYLANAGSDNTIIRSNIITKSSGEGIHVNGDVAIGGDGLVSGLTIEKNTISGSSYNGFSFDGLQDSLIQNNLVYGNSRHGLRGYDGDAASGPKNLKIINNTFAVPSTGGWPIKFSQDGGGHVIFNNILLNESLNGSIVVGNIQFTSNNNILANKFSINSETSTISFAEWQAKGYDTNSKTSSVNDVFVNTATNNYHLKDGALAIDAGKSSFSNISAPPTDLEGAIRPQGINFDVGAYEKAASTPPSPPGDTTPPIISNIKTSDITSNAVTISWTTNEASTSQIDYGISVDYNLLTSPDTNLTTAHRQVITGLTPDITYHFRVKSKDSLNNQSFSSDQLFTTPFHYKKPDFNKDKKVNQSDFDILKKDFGRTDKPISDIDQNGIVDSVDLGIMMSEWNE